jgi:2-hydroxy-3-keto-5-methylthiopentenyl-1-phosphate phosphatase
VSRLVVVDFDGTITERDTLDEMCRIYAPEEWAAAEDDLQRRTMTLREVIAAEFAPIKGDHDTIVSETVDRARIRKGFAEFVRAAEAAGDRVVVVSSGFESVIRPILEREGLDHLEVIAHDVRFTADGGVVDFRHGEPCPVCGEECKRSVVDAMRDGREVAYVGDGYSDRCAAQAADVRFARRTLASYLDAEDVEYIAFDDFTTVREALLGPDAA